MEEIEEKFEVFSCASQGNYILSKLNERRDIDYDTEIIAGNETFKVHKESGQNEFLPKIVVSNYIFYQELNF